MPDDESEGQPLEGKPAAADAAGVPIPDTADPHHPLMIRKSAMLTAGVGIAHALLLIAATLLITTQAPDLQASDEEFIAFYSNPDSRRLIVIAGLYLVPFAGIAFIWFFVALRMWVSGSARRESILLSNVQLVSGIIYTALLFAGGASMSVYAVSAGLSDRPIDPAYARQFPQLGSMLLLVFAMRMAAMFVLTTSNIGRIARILPTWFVWISYAVSIGLLLSASVSPLLILVFPGWILIFSVILLNRARRIPHGLVVPPADRPISARKALKAIQR
jgi:hypothetical protein